MAVTRPRYSMQEFAERGEAIYERDVEPKLQPEDKGKFVAIDIETGKFECDEDEQTADDRLRSRVSEPQVWLRRVGDRCVRRFGRAIGGDA